MFDGQNWKFVSIKKKKRKKVTLASQQVSYLEKDLGVDGSNFYHILPSANMFSLNSKTFPI